MITIKVLIIMTAIKILITMKIIKSINNNNNDKW